MSAPAVDAVQAELDLKAFATLQAMLALKGFSLHELSCGGFLVSRWDRTAHLSDLSGVRQFLQRLGGDA